MEAYTSLMVAVLTLMAWSMLYRENPFYRVVESLIIGFGMGYTLYITIDTLQKIWISPMIGGNWLLLVPAILGFLLFTSFTERYRFLSRWGVAAIAGSGAGFAVSRAVPVQIIGQVKPFFINLQKAAPLEVFNWVVILATTLSTIAFFTFTREHRGVLGRIAKLGRLSMMAAFGATFGATIGGDILYIIERSIFLAKAPQVYLLPVAILLIVVDIIRKGGKR